MNDISRSKARELLEELKMGEPPIDVERIATCCGLLVEYVNKGEGFFGQLLRERRVIEVQDTVHLHGQRFTIAHELGHYVLGHDPVFSASGDDIGEAPRHINDRQANAFASELLIPEPQIKKYWTELKKDYKAMARRFQVSEMAMFLRLQDAKLV